MGVKVRVRVRVRLLAIRPQTLTLALALALALALPANPNPDRVRQLTREEIRERLERAGLSGLEDKIMEGIELLKRQVRARVALGIGVGDFVPWRITRCLSPIRRRAPRMTSTTSS